MAGMKLPFDFWMDSIFYWMSIFSRQTLYWGRYLFLFSSFWTVSTWNVKNNAIYHHSIRSGASHHSCLKNITKKRRGKHFLTIRSISFKKVGGGGRKRRKMTESWNDVGWLYLSKVQLNPMKWLESCMRQMNTYFGQFHDLTFNLICNLV